MSSTQSPNFPLVSAFQSLRACLIVLYLVIAGDGFAAPTAFSGTLVTGFFAIDAASFAKIPDAVLADSAKLTGFLTRTGKAGMVYQILSAETPVRDGIGKLEKDLKDWKEVSEFQWQGNSAVPVGNGIIRMSGTSLCVTVSTPETGDIKMTHDFRWVRAPDHPLVYGPMREISYYEWQHLTATGSVIVQRGQPALAAWWRSEIPPPGCKASGHWQYMLFYTLR